MANHCIRRLRYTFPMVDLRPLATIAALNLAAAMSPGPAFLLVHRDQPRQADVGQLADALISAIALPAAWLMTIT